ncbi:MAG TPA: ABC transporter ATP-binding protein [Candidatus Magasanikbacteria bacterium]|nr:ABC transporter ATP-binding protein [Candidatus Magasanikbacteria bacterium]
MEEQEKQEKLDFGLVKQTLRIFASFYKKRWQFLVLMVIFTVINQVLEIIVPIYYKKIVDFLSVGIFDTAIKVLLIVFVLKLVSFIFQRAYFFVVSYFETYGDKDIQQFCVIRMLEHSFSFFNDQFIGSLVRKINKFAGAFFTLNDIIFFELSNLFIGTGGICVVLYGRNPILAYSVLVWLLFFILLNLLVLKGKMKIDIESNKEGNKTTGYAADVFANYSNVKLFGKTEEEIKNLENKNETIRLLNLKSWRYSILFFAIQGFLFILLEVGINYLAIGFFQKDILTIGDFVMIQAYVVMIMMNVWGLGRSIQRLYESMADATEMTAIITKETEVKDIENAKNIKVTKGEIVFDKVNFGYKENNKIFENFSLTVKDNEKLALVGPSGSGKSTVIKLLLRMYNLNKGKINIDRQDISKVTKESLWENISFVPQDPALFHRSLFENIAYGKKGATKEEVEEAAKKAYAHDFIIKLKEGYNTEVGERGIKLSGGERQRVAIARAILKNAPILIMDEATSSLDSESEQLIQKALENLMKEKTVIVVAHRLSTIAKMDRVIVMEEGKIIEEGNHSDLIKANGLYAKLWHIQAGGFIV